MKALSLIEPWASLVALGHKRVETRSWAPPPSMIGQRIAIHASKSREAIVDGTADRLFKLAGAAMPEAWPLGRIIAVATIAKAQRTEEARALISSKEESFGNYSPGRWAWILVDVHELRGPLTIRGMLGLWTVPLSFEDELLRRIL